MCNLDECLQNLVLQSDGEGADKITLTVNRRMTSLTRISGSNGQPRNFTAFATPLQSLTLGNQYNENILDV